MEAEISELADVLDMKQEREGKSGMTPRCGFRRWSGILFTLNWSQSVEPHPTHEERVLCPLHSYLMRPDIGFKPTSKSRPQTMMAWECKGTVLKKISGVNTGQSPA